MDEISSEDKLAATMVQAIESWLGHRHNGYDFVKIGKLMAAVDTAGFIRDHMPLARIYPRRGQLHREALHARTIPGLVLEFGVAGGQSINFIAGQVGGDKVYGFDSFEGLPEAWTASYRAGHFAQALPEVADNVELVVGLFDKSLPAFLQEHPGDVSFMHVDCDLYSSTRTIFELLAPRIRPGTVIVFDEYFNYPTWRDHEHKAFMEFVEKHQVAFRYLGAVNCNKQVAVQIDAIGHAG
jgi:predicted O-methyltransferase YrrM